MQPLHSSTPAESQQTLDDIPDGSLRDRIAAKLALVSQLLHQQPKGADKIYALHETQVDCISKGKARVRYEFGCKVSVTTTLDEGFVVGMRSFPATLTMVTPLARRWNRWLS
jgi:transposase, IS5 family